MDFTNISSSNKTSSIVNSSTQNDIANGQQTAVEKDSELGNTTVQSEQATTSLTSNNVVTQVAETDAATNSNTNQIGNTIDITV